MFGATGGGSSTTKFGAPSEMDCEVYGGVASPLARSDVGMLGDLEQALCVPPFGHFPQPLQRQTRRLLQKGYRVFVEQQGFRRSIEEDQLDEAAFRQRVSLSSQRYQKIIEQGRAEAVEEHGERFGFRLISMLFELYDVFYFEKQKVLVQGHQIPSISYTPAMVKWCHNHVARDDANTFFTPDWDNLCRCLVQGYFSRALNMLEELSCPNPELSTLIRELSDNNFLLCNDEYAAHLSAAADCLTDLCVICQGRMVWQCKHWQKRLGTKSTGPDQHDRR